MYARMALAVILGWAAALTLAVLPAGACACGAVVGASSTSAGGAPANAQEQAHIAFSAAGTRMQLRLAQSPTEDVAGLLLPLDGRPRSVGAGDERVFQELEKLAQPERRTVHRRGLFDTAPAPEEADSGYAGTIGSAGPGGGVDVEQRERFQTRAGTVEAVVLAGRDVRAVGAWLKANRFPTVSEEIATVLQSYLDDDWRILAARLVVTRDTDAVPVVAVELPGRARYPLRLSTLARDHVSLLLDDTSGVLPGDVLEHEEATDVPAGGLALTVDSDATSQWAGLELADGSKRNRISTRGPAGQFDLVASVQRDGSHRTLWHQQPLHAQSADVTFERENVPLAKPVQITGEASAPVPPAVVLGVPVLALIAGGVLWRRRRSRRPADQPVR